MPRSAASGPAARGRPRLHDRIVLPVCGREVVLREPDGALDLLLNEWRGSPLALACAVVDLLVQSLDGEPVDWATLCVTDLDMLMLCIRQRMLGDRISSDIVCPVPGCGEPIAISFSIADYLDHIAAQRRPARRRQAATPCLVSPGRYRLDPAARVDDQAVSDEAGITFRLPTVADQAWVADSADPEAELLRRCVTPLPLPPRTRRRIEAAMEALAPAVAGDLAGQCPECGTQVTTHFDPRSFCVQELRQHARFVYEEVDLLARRYRWTEPEILALPRARRQIYADLARP